MTDRIYAFWCRTPSQPNFGDALTPWLIRRLAGQTPVFVRPEDYRLKYTVVGSILNHARARCIVWGSGIVARHDPVSPAAKLLSVRGPLSRARAIECGADCPEIYGDPALLLPQLYKPVAAKRHGVGIVPHYSDMPRFRGRWSDTPALRMIDIQDPIETVIDRITACEAIASSSLYGLIIGHAYGIPALWVKVRDWPGSDDSKFHDHYLSLGKAPPAAFHLDPVNIDAAKLARLAPPPPRMPDLRPLLRACPFQRGA